MEKLTNNDKSFKLAVSQDVVFEKINEIIDYLNSLKTQRENPSDTPIKKGFSRDYLEGGN
jgi:hypothetical protein